MWMYNMNRIWNGVKRTLFGKLVQRECDLPLAMDLHRGGLGKTLGLHLLNRPLPILHGGNFGSESRRYIGATNTGSIATTGANSRNFNVFDWTLVSEVGFVWTVAGTVTALVMDFDLHDQLDGGNLLTDKLDVTNGVITAPTVAGQAIGTVLYKDIDATGPVLIQPGYSIQAIVTTTTTAGNGTPFVIGYPKAETFLNLPTARRATSA